VGRTGRKLQREENFKGDEMRKSLFFGAVCFWATVLMAGGKFTPLNVKTGLWQDTATTIVTGGLGIPPEMMSRLTPEQRARYEAAMKHEANGTPKTRTYKACLTQKQLNEEPFADRNHGNMKCKETVINSTSSDFEVREQCAEGSANSDIHMKVHAIDSGHVVGNSETTATMGGRTMHSTMKLDFKWVGATCPAGVH
jgi:hypothetical protein